MMKQPMKGHGKGRAGWRGFQSSSCRRNEEEKKGTKTGSREVATGSWQDSPSPVRPVGRHRWDWVNAGWLHKGEGWWMFLREINWDTLWTSYEQIWMCVHIIYLGTTINLHITYIYFNINHLTQARAKAHTVSIDKRTIGTTESMYRHPDVRDGS